MLPQHPPPCWARAMADSGELVLATHNGGHVGATDKAHFLRSIADGAWADGDPPALVDFFYRSNRKATVAVKRSSRGSTDSVLGMPTLMVDARSQGRAIQRGARPSANVTGLRQQSLATTKESC